MDTRLRQLRVVLQQLEQDDVEVVAPRLESKHVDTSKTKMEIWAEGTTQRAIRTKKNKMCKFQKNVPRENLFPLRFKLIRKN